MGEMRNLWPPLPRMTQRLPNGQVGVARKRTGFEVSSIRQPPTVDATKTDNKKEREGKAKGNSHPRKGWRGGI